MAPRHTASGPFGPYGLQVEGSSDLSARPLRATQPDRTVARGSVAVDLDVVVVSVLPLAY
jgi:hypothetical protein